MTRELYTFADNTAGLEHAFDLTLHLRSFGFRTRLATRQITGATVVHTVIATPPTRTRTAFSLLNAALNGEKRGTL